MSRRIGRFYIPLELIEAYAKVRPIFDECVPVRAEMLIENKKIEYVAISPHFDEISESERAPTYDIELNGGRARFIRQ